MGLLKSKFLKKFLIGAVCLSCFSGIPVFAGTLGYESFHFAPEDKIQLSEDIVLDEGDDDISISIVSSLSDPSGIIYSFEVIDLTTGEVVWDGAGRGSYTFTKDNKLNPDHVYTIRTENLSGQELDLTISYNMH